jgi:hypothetical protein
VGPASFELGATQFYSFQQQRELSFELAKRLPPDHYGRKNLGYLQAMHQNAACIYETDDDNSPKPHWQARSLSVSPRRLNGNGWTNVYRLFTDELIWPRGLPLSHIHSPATTRIEPEFHPSCRAPIQQGLADGSPDVDSVWRMILGREFAFEDRPSVLLPRGCWCPFNSQSTWWWPAAYPLMYLPSYCSLRMTDVWRSFVSQRCLWEFAEGLVFHAPEVIQDRNEHVLQRDFEKEVDGFLNNESFVRCLDDLPLQPGEDSVKTNLLDCYRALVDEGFFPPEELALVKAWVSDIASMGVFKGLAA